MEDLRETRLFNLTEGVQLVFTLDKDEDNDNRVSMKVVKEVEGLRLAVTFTRNFEGDPDGYKEAHKWFNTKRLDTDWIEKMANKGCEAMHNAVDGKAPVVKLLSKGVQLIEAERYRQIEVLKYDVENDALYDKGQLLEAAAAYVVEPKYRLNPDVSWPWKESSFKPTPDNRILELTKAGALIAAEIDRLINLENTKKDGSTN